MEAFMRLQGADDSVSRLSRPRYLNKYPNQICIFLIHLEKRLHLLPAWFARHKKGIIRHRTQLLLLHFGYENFRFGKRSEASAADQRQSDIEAFMRLQGADDSVSRLSRPRYLNWKNPTPILIHLQKWLHFLPAWNNCDKKIWIIRQKTRLFY